MEHETTALTLREQALLEHKHICECGERAVEMIVEIGLSLKRIRDGKLFAELGYESFADYVEHNGDYSFKERQAYTYIELVEQNPPEYLTAHGDLGVTKLSVLSRLPGFEREDFIEEHKVAGLTVREVEELIKAHQGQGEQLSLLTEEKTAAEKEAEELRARVAELEQRPTEVAVREPTPEELEAIRAAERKEADKRIRQIKKELKAAQDKEVEKKTADLKAKAEAAEKQLLEAQEAETRLKKALEGEQAERRQLQEKLSAGNPDEVKAALKVYFEEAQKAVTSFLRSIPKLQDAEEQKNFTAAAAKWLRQEADILDKQ
jgi:hypothetical protein